MTRVPVDFGTHNLNGNGRPTNVWAANRRILLTTETNNPGHTRNPVGRVRWDPWLVPQNPSLCIAVTRRSGFLDGIDRDDDTRVRRLHQSGRAEDWDIATPARHVVRRDITLVGHPASVILTHMVEDAWHTHTDAQTKERRHIWSDVEWPLILAMIEAAQDEERLILFGGDVNRRDCPTPHGLRRLTNPGLDHLFVSDDPRIAGERTVEGAKSGHGGYTHNSVTARLSVRAA